MPDILIVYASRHGHTAKVAQRLAESVLEPGVSVVSASVADAPCLRVADFDGIIVGGSIHIGDHDPELLAWVRENRHDLQRLPSGFFSVSMAAIEDGSPTAREYIDRFVEDTDWTPGRSIAVAGALQYPAYSFMTRQMVRQIAAHKGLSTDLSRETEYTDWSALEQFGQHFTEKVGARVGFRAGCGLTLTGSAVAPR
jgi:menaquinone-dependent protoporphyrinogen oxidase